MAELFDDFEINRKPRWPRLVRSLAGSVVLHALFVLAVAVAPTARALLHLVGMASGADYVSEDYTLGDIRERATIVKFGSPQEKLYYPPGYFETNAPNAELARDAEVLQKAARVEPTPKPPKPQPTPTPAATPTPTPGGAAEVAQSNRIGDDDEKPLTEAELKEREEKEKREALDKLADQNKVKLPPKINSKPYKDLLVKWNDRYENGGLNLKGTISVTLEADREPDGTLSNMVMTGGSASDASLKELAEDVVKALSASHALSFLEGTRHLKMTLLLDQKKLSVTANSEVESAEYAQNMATTYGAGILFQRLKTGGKDEGALWQNTSVESSGNKIVIRFQMPRDTASTLLAKQVPALKKDANK